MASKPALVAVAAATSGGAIKGRPVLQDDGRLLVTFETTCAVGPGHGMWDAARAAMNAP